MKKYKVQALIKEIGGSGIIRMIGKKLSDRAMDRIKNIVAEEIINDPVYQHYEEVKDAFRNAQISITNSTK